MKTRHFINWIKVMPFIIKKSLAPKNIKNGLRYYFLYCDKIIFKNSIKVIGITTLLIIGPMAALSPLLFIPSVFATFSMSRPDPFAKPKDTEPDLSFNHTDPTHQKPKPWPPENNNNEK